MRDELTNHHRNEGNMSNEMNATIDEIMRHAQEFAGACTDADANMLRREMRSMITEALDSQARKIEALTARLTLASGCLERAGWEYIPDAIYGPVWKPPVNKIAADLRARLRERDAEIDALVAERGAASEIESQLSGLLDVTSQELQSVMAERDELRKRLEEATADAERRGAEAMRTQCALVCDTTPPQPFRPSIEAAHAIRALPLPTGSQPAEVKPGEWIKWRGERRPDGLVPDEVRLRDGSVLIGWLEGFWTWSACSKYGRDIVAYRILP